MELPFQLRTLEPLKGALDIMRMLGTSDHDRIDGDTFMDELGLTERTFSKAMRRLITKNYVQMDGNMTYRLTDAGRRLTEDLLAYDTAEGSSPRKTSHVSVKQVARRLVCAVPSTLGAGQPAQIFVGFHPATNASKLSETIELVVRTSIVNGEPTTPEDLLFSLDNEEIYQAVTITAGHYTLVRIRMEAYQLGEMGDISEIGGMFVDVPVTASPEARFIAYGTDVQLVG